MAILEPSVGIAFPQRAIPKATALNALEQLVRERGVQKIVVGVPLTARGEVTPQAQKILQWVGKLKTRAPQAEVIYVDEHLSSEDVSERLKEAGKSVADARRSGELDCLVATLLLEGHFSGNIPAIVLPANVSPAAIKG